jgi:NAD(P)-dependent dehydrogenase (short-subunit alcohol dehydrogenase family)
MCELVGCHDGRLPHAVVTGASTGIGRASVKRLGELGFHVFATVRNEVDADSLRDEFGRKISPVLADVTDADQVKGLADAVRGHVAHRGLDVLVNNAGVGLARPLEAINLDQLRASYAVNIEAPIAVTQALLPLIRVASGRILMITSIGARITLPFAGPLASAKHALRSLSEALRQELSPWGIRVIQIEPASIRTNAIDKLEADLEFALAEFDEANRRLYADTYRRAIERALKMEQEGSPPSVVAEVVGRAATAAHPKSRYLVGKHARLLATVAQFPTGVQDAFRRRVMGLPRPGARVGTGGAVRSL